MRRFVLAVLLLTVVFGGYAVYQQLTSPLLSAQDIAATVGTIYGDQTPHIVKVLSTEAEGPGHEPMYILTLQGHFQNQGRTARYLIFSALRNRWSAGALWAGNNPPGPKSHRSWRVDTVPFPVDHS